MANDMDLQYKNYLKLIEQSYSIDHVKKFTTSCLTKKQLILLQQSCSEILQMIPPKPFDCAQLSAMLVEIARQKGIHAYLVAGILDFKNKRIFNYDSIIERENIIENWDGHCWVIFNNAIAEISLFRTAYSEKAPKWLNKMIVDAFGSQRGAIIADVSEIQQIGLSYSPKYILNDLQISGLLNSSEQLISKTWNIPIDQTTSRIASPNPGFT